MGPRHRQAGRSLTGHTTLVFEVAFNRDGTQLASAGADATVRLWNRIWDPDEACELADPYVTRAQVQEYMPSDWEPACRYAE